MLYVYDADIIDYFKGMSMLDDYIWLCETKRLYDKFHDVEHDDYLTPRELKTFLIKCFMAVRTSESYWEGDIRGNNIAISAIPRMTSCDPFLLLAFKQDNNGSSWIVSECILDNYDPENDIKRLSSRKDLDSLKLIEILDRSYDLVEAIYEKALHNKSSDKIEPVPIITASKYTVGTQLCNEQVKFDKFNMTNYERVK